MHKKLTVGIFTYDFYPIKGGIGRFVYEFYRQSLKNSEFNVKIFSPSNISLKNHVSIFSSSEKGKFKHFEFSLRLHAKINSLIKEYGLDVIHIQGGPGGVLFIKKVSIPVIYTVHHTYWQQSEYVFGEKWKKLFMSLEKLGYARAEKIICDVQSTKLVLERKYGVRDSKISVIPIGINITRKNPVALVSTGRDILYVGRIDKRKGVDFLIDTMKIVKRYAPEIRLHIVGKGSDKEKLERYCRDNKLNVVFYGFLSDKDLDNLRKLISIQIVPSVFEGFGIAVLEGMAKGLPIIATDVDGLRDIVKDGYNGMLIQYGDKVGLSKLIIDLANDREKQDNLRRNAFTSLNKYNWAKIYKKTSELYLSII